jgi:uncharacterized protein YutE (UPF0331/DUF86 family)
MLAKIDKKIAKIKKYIKILEELKADCKEKFLSDEIYQGALLHYLYLVSDSSISLAQMVLKYNKVNVAQSYYEAIDMLGEEGIISKEFAYDFAKIASLRNFLAHDYEQIDYLIICDEILNKLDDIKKYLNFIEKSL